MYMCIMENLRLYSRPVYRVRYSSLEKEQDFLQSPATANDSLQAIYTI